MRVVRPADSPAVSPLEIFTFVVVPILFAGASFLFAWRWKKTAAAAARKLE